MNMLLLLFQTDTQVTFEDQQKINRFARTNARLMDLKEELTSKEVCFGVRWFSFPSSIIGIDEMFLKQQLKIFIVKKNLLCNVPLHLQLCAQLMSCLFLAWWLWIYFGICTFL